jgi:hypothetical protein
MHRSVRLAALGAAAILACSEERVVNAPDEALEVEKLQALEYPAPVSGKISDANAGTYDLVDGIAYASPYGRGTVVFVVAKPIASTVLATSSCPATQARALVMLRDASYAEVTLDAKGDSPTFLYGSPYGGSGRAMDSGGREWSSDLELDDGRAKGSVEHGYYGEWEFDLPIAKVQPTEVSEDDRFAAGHMAWGGDAPVPSEGEAIAAYDRARRAVLEDDLAGYLKQLGFTDEEASKIRRLDGLRADFARHRQRFLKPGVAEEPMLAPGVAQVGARGKNGDGADFANYYQFTLCAGRLILTGVYLNPQ